jgi:acyl-CoA dehydrogenase family protein 9
VALLELFNGRVPPDFPALYDAYDASDDEIVQLLGRSLRRFLEEKADAAAMDRDKKMPPEVLKGLADLGAFGLAVPEEYGGAGLNMEGFCNVLREIAYVESSVGVTVGAATAIGTHGIKLFGTAEQKKRFLPDIAAGRRIAAFAITEAEAGTDLANISTRAVLNEDKTAFTIDGSKIFITNGGFGGTFTILAKTPGLARTAGSMGLFVVNADTPGFGVGPPEDKLGIRASSTTELTFENMVVPRENLLGSGINGLELVKGVLNWGRMSLAAGCLGAMGKIVKMAAGHAATRVQFDEPIGAFGCVRHLMADIAADTFALEAMVTVTSKLYDNHPDRAGMATSITKIFSSDRAFRATDALVQIFGGMGYIEETGAARLFRDARINKIFEGTNEIIKVLSALEGVVSISNKVEGPTSIRDFVPDILANQAQAFDRALAFFHEYALAQRTRFGIRIRLRELVLERVADMAVDVYALFSLLMHTAHLVRTRGADRCAMPLAVTHKAAAEIDGRLRAVAGRTPEGWDRAVKEISDIAYETLA